MLIFTEQCQRLPRDGCPASTGRRNVWDWRFRTSISEKQLRVTNELLDLPNPPTCIIYPDDFASFGGINAIRQRGLQIPEDISVAGYDGIQAARQLEPRLTTVQQDTELISLIERPKTTIIEQVIVPGKVAEGKSVARIPTDN